MTDKELKRLIDTIGMALSHNHGTIAIDDPKAEPTEISWRVDNSTAVAALTRLAAHLGVPLGADPR